MITLLIKASIVLIVLLAFYKLLLEKESFFGINRVYLLSCLFFAAILPFISLPKMVDHQGYLASWIEKKEISAQKKTEPAINIYPASPNVAQAGSENKIEENNQIPAIQPDESAASTNEKNNSVTTFFWENRGSSFWIALVYLFGVIVLGLNLLAQVAATLFKALKNPDKIVDEESIIVNMTSKTEPCSFFRYIFINPAGYDYETYEQILAHEKIHVKKWHTIDLLLSEIAVVVLWFNPLVWVFRKEVEKNIEYQTDDLLVRQEEDQKEEYQMNLLKIATYNQPLAVTTNYNQSLIKQRILKMNTKRSNPYSGWKYAFLAPVLFALLLVLNQPNTAHAKSSGENQMNTALTDFSQNNTFSTSPQEEKNEGEQSNREPSQREEVEFDESLTEYLFKAIKEGQPETLELLIRKGADVDVQIREGWTLLMEATGNGKIEMVRLLIEKGADVNLKTDRGYTALMEAAEEGFHEIAQLLIQNGADVNAKTNEGYSVLLLTVDDGFTEIARLLIESGADVNTKRNDGLTALHEAVDEGDLEMVKLLVDHGADLTAAFSDDITPLRVAIKNNHLAVIDYLLSKGVEKESAEPELGAAEMNDCRALLRAVKTNNTTRVKELLQSVDPDCAFYEEGEPRSPLVAAARNGNLEIGKLIVEAGGDIEYRARGDESPLMAAAKFGHLDFVKYLLKQGADINRKVSGDGTALLVASGHGQKEVVQYLIDQKAEVNATVGGDGNALINAVKGGHYETARILLENGADPYQNVPGDEYAMYHARVSNNARMIALLKQYEK